MPSQFHHRFVLNRAILSCALVFVVASCRETELPTQSLIEPEPPVQMNDRPGVLNCTVNVAGRSVNCAGDVGLPSGGDALYDKIVGGQGVYVRLTSTNVTYAADLFAFDVSVQNLLTLAMGTADGATRDAGGVRVFLHSPLVATGGSGALAVANATGTGAFTAADQPYFQYGGAIGGIDQSELGADGILSTAEVSAVKNWQFQVPASVTSFAFSVYVTAETPVGETLSAAPAVTSISPATLIPGQIATLTGLRFHGTPGSNSVMIGGRAATVTGGDATSLTVRVPCVGSGTVGVTVAQGGMQGAAYNAPLQVTQRTIGVGQSVVVSSSADSHCNELPATNADSRYIVSVFSASTSPTSNAPFQISANNAEVPATFAGDALLRPDRAQMPAQLRMELTEQEQRDRKHYELLEMNRRLYQQLRSNPPVAARPDRTNDTPLADTPPLTRTFRIANINVGNACNSFYVVSATRVYYNGKLAIYEDDATPDAFKVALNATMSTNIQKIGDQFNADMEPIIRNNFGDVLRRDAVTDNNGVLIALFTPRINTSFSGVAGFVISCDQYPNDDTSTPAVGGPYTGTGFNGSSNFGEVFYAYQPVTNAAGYSGNTPDNWYRTIRSTFIHETKHVASMAARTANNTGNLEDSWLEEGTARHSEELWMRNAVDNVAWKANTGYGSAANPINYYCDSRPTGWVECDANPRRPANIMQRHFSSLYTHMYDINARLLSPFGPTPSDNGSYWYAISWSLVRYTIDRYGVSDADFLTALTQSSLTGAANLTARAGVSLDQLLGGWNLALAADDHPLAGGAQSADTQIPTWNFRNIYQGMNTDFPGTYTRTYPLIPGARSFGSFTPTALTTLRGGGSLWYELSGTQAQAQLLRLEANGGGLPPSNLRIAITRIH